MQLKEPCHSVIADPNFHLNVGCGEPLSIHGPWRTGGEGDELRREGAALWIIVCAFNHFMYIISQRIKQDVLYALSLLDWLIIPSEFQPTERTSSADTYFVWSSLDPSS